MLVDNLEFAFKNIRKRLIRTSLTVLGISIGIMGVVALMGLGEGLTQAVVDELAPLSDMIIVKIGELPSHGELDGSLFVDQKDINMLHSSIGDGDGEVIAFTDRDVKDIERTSGVKQVALVNSGFTQVVFNNEVAEIKILGIDPSVMQDMYGEDSLEQGSLIKSGEQNKCIVGFSVSNEYFGRTINEKDRILINEEKFIVKGTYKKKGGGLWYQNDDTIHVSMRDFEKITGEENIDTIIVKVYDVGEVESIAKEIEEKINGNHGNNNLFSTLTMTSIMESIMQVVVIIQTVLLGVASIALIVAAIGIMNMMLTDVIERTREIGIMKAIGATNKDVLYVFLSEGALISIIGGLVGLVLGYIGAIGICSVVSAFIDTEFTAVITPISVIMSLLLALFVGITFSYYPAKRASKMNPVEAISYE